MTLPFSLDTVIWLGGALLVIALVIWIIRLEKKIGRLTAGASGASLEKVIYALVEQVKATDQVNEEIKAYLVKMDERIGRSVQHVKTIRYNPFPDQGGNQSFAIAWLDEAGNGTVMSSLFARDKMSVYAKPVRSYDSEFELSQEERAALSKA